MQMQMRDTSGVADMSSRTRTRRPHFVGRRAGNVCESARGARRTVLADARNYMESIYFIIGFLTAVLWSGALDDCDDY